MIRKFIAALVLAVTTAMTPAVAKTVPVTIVTPAYTLVCHESMAHNQVTFVCLPKHPTLENHTAFSNWRYGDALPQAIFVDSPSGNGGAPPQLSAADNSITVGGSLGAATVALSTTQPNANTWNSLQTFVSGETLQAPLTFSATSMTPPSTAGIYSDTNGGLHLVSASAQLISVANKISMSNSIAMNNNALTSVGHVGSYAVCTVSNGGTINTNGGDTFCLVTLTSGAATVNFHQALSGTQMPICHANDQTASTATVSSVVPSGTSGSWTGYTVHGTGSDVIAVSCFANGGA